MNSNSTAAEIMTVGQPERTGLLKVVVKFEGLGLRAITVSALVDGGSTHSFISPNALSGEYIRALAACSNKDCRRQNYLINGATGSAASEVEFMNASIRVQAWSGAHEFAITKAVCRYDMIIGRDFLSKYDVDISHGGDTMTIDGEVIQLNGTKNLNSIALEKQVKELELELIRLKSLSGSHDKEAEVVTTSASKTNKNL